MAKTDFKTVDEYVASFPPDVQATLESIRRTIREAAPQSQEKISYQLPTITLDGKYLVYFAAWKKHIAFYTLPVEAFKTQLGDRVQPKGTVHFALDKPMPLELIREMVTYKVEHRES